MKYQVLCYTRMPQEDMIYSNRLAYSMHLALSVDGKEFEALNHNSGVLFAKATDNTDGTINAKSLKNPYLFELPNGAFGVVAIRTGADGEEDEESKGKVLLFETEDLLQYKEIGLIDLRANTYIKDVICGYEEEKQTYVIKWCNELGEWFENDIADLGSLEIKSDEIRIEPVVLQKIPSDIEGILTRNTIAVNDKIGLRLKYKLSTPYNISIKVPEEIDISSAQELKNVRAEALYSDGTSALKTVDWNIEAVNLNIPGTYKVNGVVHQDKYYFPIAINRADPCIAKWNGKYYFIATNDADDNHTLYIREADSIPELVNAKEELLLDSVTHHNIGGLLWAPEFHVVGDDLYIFHAATPGEFFYEESHVMKLRRGGNPTCKDDWSRPNRVVKKDGSYLCEEGKTISLDMTCFLWNGDYYAVWSQRQFLPVDQGAWLYIAKVDHNEPWRLITDPVLLSKPDYGWANNHTFVDEGPFALITDKKLFLTFSSAAVDATYVVGLLTAEHGADLLNPCNWTKYNYPLLTSRSVSGQFGPGHNAYVIDDNGDVWNTYHARPGVNAPRSSGIRRVHFDIDGFPVLDLTEEKDLDPDLRVVTLTLNLK